MLWGIGIRKVAAAGLLLVAQLTGGADYLNRYDTVTLAAGDAQRHSLMLQHKDPFNPASKDTNIPTDGQRIADVMATYRPQRPTSQQPVNVTVNTGGADDNNPCDYGWQLDRAGNPCGKRSADDRPGGEDPPGGKGM